MGLVIETALWWHDAVYDPRAAPGSNERRSACLAGMVLQEGGRLPSFIDCVTTCIIATDHAGMLEDESAKLTADIDLAGLCLPEDQFLANSRRIRTEYHYLSDEDWRKGRRSWLTGMLKRPRIYQSDRFGGEAESKARANLHAELEWLRKFGDSE